jgi:hypothetical protein
MTRLNDFLNSKEEDISNYFEPVDGSFQCQNKECHLITYEAFFDKSHNKIKWTCANGHDSSVVV